MKKLLSFTLLFSASILLMSGCQKAEILKTAILQDQSGEIKKCLVLQNTVSGEEFGYLYEQFNDVSENGWYPIKDIDKEESVYMGLSIRKGEGVQGVVLEDSSSSGDWYRVDDYCFGKNNVAVGLYSDLRTFYGDVQVIRTWTFDDDGSVSGEETKIIDLDTDEPVDPESTSYMDSPPYLASSYEDLLKHLDFEQ